MDNCGGQNKNNMVLRLSALFVELGLYDKVNFIFYIVGHTKNACDRWFNILKRKYRKSNLYSYDELLKCMETHKNITVRNVENGDFLEMENFLNKFYKRLKPGSMKNNYIFSLRKDNPTLLFVKRDDIDGSPEETQVLKKGTFLDRKQTLMEEFTNIPMISELGIPEIKQVELYTKFRVLLPTEYQDITCPHPGDNIMNKIKAERKERAKKRAKTNEMEGKTETEKVATSF